MSISHYRSIVAILGSLLVATFINGPADLTTSPVVGQNDVYFLVDERFGVVPYVSDLDTVHWIKLDGTGVMNVKFKTGAEPCSGTSQPNSQGDCIVDTGHTQVASYLSFHQYTCPNCPDPAIIVGSRTKGHPISPVRAFEELATAAQHVAIALNLATQGKGFNGVQEHDVQYPDRPSGSKTGYPSADTLKDIRYESRILTVRPATAIADVSCNAGGPMVGAPANWLYLPDGPNQPAAGMTVTWAKHGNMEPGWMVESVPATTTDEMSLKDACSVAPPYHSDALATKQGCLLLPRASQRIVTYKITPLDGDTQCRAPANPQTFKFSVE